MKDDGFFFFFLIRDYQSNVHELASAPRKCGLLIKSLLHMHREVVNVWPHADDDANCWNISLKHALSDLGELVCFYIHPVLFYFPQLDQLQ